jgi:hypothetical protein
MANVTDDDRASLISFLDLVYDLLQNIYLEGGYRSLRVIDSEDRPIFAPAWLEFREQLPLGRITAVTMEVSGDRLVAAGLYGSQLSLKTTIVGRAYRAFLRRPTQAILESLLAPINTFLRSLLDALGVGSALGELKDMVEDYLQRDREPS